MKHEWIVRRTDAKEYTSVEETDMEVLDIISKLEDDGWNISSISGAGYRRGLSVFAYREMR